MTDSQLAFKGVADETAVTAGLSGTGDSTTVASINSGAVLTVDQDVSYGGFPFVRADQASGSACGWRTTVTAGAGGVLSAQIKLVTPAAWPSSAFRFLQFLDASGNQLARCTIAGSGSPGQVRIVAQSGTNIVSSPTGVLGLGGEYVVELALTPGTSGSAQLRVWDADGDNLLYDSGLQTGDYTTAAVAKIEAGNASSTPTVGTYWLGLLRWSDSIKTWSGRPLGYAAPVTELQLAFKSVADETAVTAGLSGTGDSTTVASVNSGAVLKVDTAVTYGGFPYVRADQASGSACAFRVNVTPGAGGVLTAQVKFKTPASWASSAHRFLQFLDGTGKQLVRCTVGGSGNPGQVRMVAQASTNVVSSANGVLALSTDYVLELSATPGASGTARLRVWSANGDTLAYDSGTQTADLTAAAPAQIEVGNATSTPTVPQHWFGLLRWAPAIKTWSGRPLGYSLSPTGTSVRGVIVAGVEVAASLRGVIVSGSEVAASVQGISAGGGGGGGGGGGIVYPPGWTTLIFNDDFTGTVLDGSKWAATTNTSSSGEAYRQPANIEVHDGYLHNIGKKESAGGKQYTAGYVTGAGKFTTPTDKEWAIETRFWLPQIAGQSQGIWVAFWLRNSDQGEVDVIETWGTPETLHTRAANIYTITQHQYTDQSGSKIEKNVPCQWGQWHVSRTEHDPTSALRPWRFYLDDALVHSTDTTKAAWLSGASYSQPWHMRITYQIGNPTYWGPADPTGVTTVLPADYMTDWVRVFTR